MTNPSPSGQRSKRPVLLAGLAGVAAALAAVYVMVGAQGNKNGAESCSLELASAQLAKPHSRGEVAAFLPAQKPLSINDLKFKAPDGSESGIPDFAGRTILLNLWATWCAPCRKEMPALNELQADLGDESFEVVAVNLDKGSQDKPKDFLKDIGVDKLAFYQDSTNGVLTTLRQKARATGLPTTILIGPSGCEIGTMYGPAEWASDEAKALIKAAMANQKAS